MRNGRWAQIAPQRWRWVSRIGRSTKARSALPMPHVISDEMPPTEQVDGRFYTSKAKFRAVGRALGLTEVGNEKFKPKTRASADGAIKAQRRANIERVFAQYKEGRRPRRTD